MLKIKGCITALITPFTKAGNLDQNTLKKLIKRQIELGVHGIVPCGTTGESPTLSHDEHDKVIEIAVSTSKGRIPVIAGTGSNSTKEAIRLTKAAEKAGADASLQVVPYYNKPNQEGLFKHFKNIARETRLPIILYNIPGRSSVNLETSTIVRLEKACKNIVGIKEASGNINKVKEIIKSCSKKFIVLSGEDSLNLQILNNGGKGFISVTSNLMPKECSELYENYVAKNSKELNKIDRNLKNINKLLFVDTNPIPIKYAMKKLGLSLDNIRLPLTNLNKKKQEKINKELRKLKIL